MLLKSGEGSGYVRACVCVCLMSISLCNDGLIIFLHQQQIFPSKLKEKKKKREGQEEKSKVKEQN